MKTSTTLLNSGHKYVVFFQLISENLYSFSKMSEKENIKGKNLNKTS